MAREREPGRQAADHDQRLAALNIGQSFIVQAPAGSGKTELLTQRYLALLGQAVKAPEEIIAITFTRKAASEMRSRIIQALHDANEQPVPQQPHRLQTWQLATSALTKNNKLGWHLLDNPNRLRIQTIDSLCASIVKQLPILSSSGGKPSASDNSYQHQCYYQQAVEALFERLDQLPALQRLLAHLDNRVNRSQELLIQMLQKRDQWLNFVIRIGSINEPQTLADQLNAGLQTIAKEEIANIEYHLKQQQLDNWVASLQQCLNYAADNLAIEEKNKIQYNALEKKIDLKYQFWKLAVSSLFTRDGNKPRTRVDKTIGFPAASYFSQENDKLQAKKMKAEMQALLSQLNQQPMLCLALQQFAAAPPLNYQTQELEVILALAEVLKQSVGHLHLVFEQSGQCDYIEVAQAALRALGEAELPSQLALSLDYKIHHLLVDEFQDTAIAQFELLEKLMAGWQQDDGRSLFIVGDPMQSIYRFRDAEVGLFLRAQRHGIANIQLQSLTLSSNFRSSPKIIDWINDHCQQIFPSQANISDGAVTYAPAQSRHLAGNDNQYHPDSIARFHVTATRQQEAEQIIEIIKKQTMATAILVRSRSHLDQIIIALKSAAIPYQAVKMDKLEQKPIIKDLLALTAALLHLSDSTAWLSILRAPWCGLSLNDLYHISQCQASQTIYDRLCDPIVQRQLSRDGQKRTATISNIIQQAMSHYQRLPLSQWIEQTWQQLKGPQCLRQPQDLEDAKSYFHFLSSLTINTQRQHWTIDDISAQLQQHFSPCPAESLQASVQLLTIHEAKGLEFDRVIIPGLSRQPRHEDSILLRWLERPRQDKGADLIIAPIKITGKTNNPIFNYLKQQDHNKQQNELIRLFYVAITRSKYQLHLFADSQSMIANQASKRSLLYPLWPLVKNKFESQPGDSDEKQQQLAEEDDDNIITQPAYIQRLPIHHFTATTIKQPTETNSAADTIKHWQYYPHKHTGTLVHAILCQISHDNIDRWSDSYIEKEIPYWHQQLRSLGVDDQSCLSQLDIVVRSIRNTLSDPTGQWILQAHQQAQSELAVTRSDGKHYIIDRTFVDKKNHRWIIDYKIVKQNIKDNGDYIGLSKSFYQQQQQAYQQQLDHYKETLLALYSQTTIHCALYFPLQQHFHQLTTT